MDVKLLDHPDLKDEFQQFVVATNLQGSTLRQLDDFYDEEQFVSDAPPDHRIVARLFFRSFIRPAAAAAKAAEHQASGQAPPSVLSVPLLSVKLEGIRGLDGIGVSKLREYLLANFNESQLQSYEVLNASHSNLFDADAPLIAAAVVDLLPKCKVVDLSYNRLHGVDPSTRDTVDDALLLLLQQPSVEHVDIQGNAIASVDRVDFFVKVVKASVLAKLIFIPPAFVDSGSWQTLLTAANVDLKTVRATHTAYFKTHFAQSK